MKTKLSAKFYFLAVLLLGIVILGWYGVYFLNANEILMEDDSPMDLNTKKWLTVAMCLIVSSWTLSLLTVIRQIFLGYAFYMDESGICSTSSIMVLLAFVFVVPVKRIPYDAIEWVGEENGLFLIKINKSKIEVFPIFRPLVRKEYYFFSGLTKEKTEIIRETLDFFMRKSHSQEK